MSSKGKNSVTMSEAMVVEISDYCPCGCGSELPGGESICLHYCYECAGGYEDHLLLNDHRHNTNSC